MRFSSYLEHVIVPGVSSGDRGNWEQESLRDRSHACFAKQAWERLNLQLFRNVSVHEFYRFKALITLEQVNNTAWSKKKPAMAGCCKLSLYADGLDKVGSKKPLASKSCFV